MENIIDFKSTKLNFTEFRKTLIDGLRDICGSEFVIREEHVHKNNAKELFGVSIRNKSSNIAPTIYLESFYERYYEGKTDIEDIKNDIIRVYRQNSGSGMINVDFFKDFERVKDKLSYRLINYETNKRFLDEVPHRRVLDLAIIYVLNLNECSGSITIRNEHLDLWKTDEKELFEITESNTPKIFPFRINEFSEMLDELLEGSDAEEMNEIVRNEPVSMFILTNNKCLYGASAILYEDALKDFSDRIGSGFYMLPSSVHETILLPENVCFNTENLREMVKSVNEAVLDREDYLSDNVYYYNRENKRLEIVE